MTAGCINCGVNCGLLVKLLYQLFKDNPRDLQWMSKGMKAFEKLKEELKRAPALGLPYVLELF